MLIGIMRAMTYISINTRRNFSFQKQRTEILNYAVIMKALEMFKRHVISSMK